MNYRQKREREREKGKDEIENILEYSLSGGGINVRIDFAR